MEDSFRVGRFGGYPEFQRSITLQRLIRDNPLRNNVYAFNASRTRFFPYQFKPLLKFLESPKQRLLICDEVGLGKTIEAGLILTELKARQTLRLVLIVCPSNLREKWKLEMRQRFNEEFRIMDAAAVREFLKDYEERPERAELNAIISLETLRIEELRQRFDELAVPFDFIVFDEAHHLRNFETSQRKAALALVQSAQAVVMLTATPVHLGQENLFSLLNLLDDEDFPDQESTASRFRENELIVAAQAAIGNTRPDFARARAYLNLALDGSYWFSQNGLTKTTAEKLEAVETAAIASGRLDTAALLDLQRDLAALNLLGHILTRTRKRDVHEGVAVRRARAVTVDFTAAEQQLYDLVTETVRRSVVERRGVSANAQWMLNTPQRRMASSVQGMVEFYRSVSASADDQDDTVPFADLVASSIDAEKASSGDLAARMKALVAAWPSDGPDAKYDRLKSAIEEMLVSGRARKILVFATFKHTVRYLERRLKADGIVALSLSGDVPIDERLPVINRFRDDESVQVLLSTRVGSEGLDFQFCSTLVNYDLPWNPMEVEQRIGRLDRIGQKDPSILIVNLWTRGTIEERILQRLYDRVGIFTRSVGDLEAILGDVSKDLQRDLMRAALSDAEGEEALERVARIIDERTHQMEQLEASAASFVGVDSFFDEEITAIRARRRYVTGEQLRRFVMDFLRNHAPRTRLEKGEEAERWILTPDDQLRQFLQRMGKAGDAASVAASVGLPVSITFDAQYAYANPRVEFLSVLHPLVTAIVDFNQREPTAQSAQHVLIESATLPAGMYFVFVYRQRMKAGREHASLETIVMREDLTVAGNAPVCEIILGEMVERGISAQEPVEIDRSYASKVIDTAQLAMLERQAELKERETVSNEAFIEQRLRSLRAFYGNALRKRNDLLQRALTGNKKDPYIRMLRGHIARLEAELATAERSLEQRRTVTAELDCIAACICEVAGTVR